MVMNVNNRLKEQLAQSNGEEERFLIARKLFEHINQGSQAIVSQLQEGTNIENFDVVEAALANGFNKSSKILTKALTELNSLLIEL